MPHVPLLPGRPTNDFGCKEYRGKGNDKHLGRQITGLSGGPEATGFTAQLFQAFRGFAGRTFLHLLKATSPEGCSAVRENRMMPTAIRMAITREELKRLNSRPPLSWGFVNVSPRVAPRGRVRI